MLVVLFLLLLALITLGVPILLVMGIVGLAGIVVTPNLVPALFPQKMFAMLDNFSLLALPYFILAGEDEVRQCEQAEVIEHREHLLRKERGHEIRRHHDACEADDSHDQQDRNTQRDERQQKQEENDQHQWSLPRLAGGGSFQPKYVAILRSATNAR